MLFSYRRLVLIKRYLLISLLLSIIPLVFSAFLYDRYTSSLLDNILFQRLDTDVQGVAENMQGFMASHANNLRNLGDIPEVEQLLSNSYQYSLSENLLDLIYFHIGKPDIYSLSFINAQGEFIYSIPEGDRAHYSLPALPKYPFSDVTVIGPSTMNNHRPPWFALKNDIVKDGVIIGSIVAKLRLASLTEHAAILYRQGFYEPAIQVGEKYFSVLSESIARDDQAIQEKPIIEGWSISLMQDENYTALPRLKIRYLLLVVVALSCAAIIVVFFHMSERLARLIIPLTEGARAIAKGDFSVRVPEKSVGELKELAHSFNQMSEQLGTMIDSRVDLERRGDLGHLAAGIAHEIRNPLTTLRTTIHALSHSEKKRVAEQSRFNSQVIENHEMLDLVNEEIIRIDGIVEEFLSYARPHEPSRENIAITDFLQGIKALLSGTLADKNVRLLSQIKHDYLLHVDPSQLRQVFMNIILNAMQAMPSGGDIIISTDMDTNKNNEPMARIGVHDKGVGMDELTLDKVSTPFFTTKTKGSGLGLSICAQLLRKNGGDLVIESQFGEGTSVWVNVPLASHTLMNNKAVDNTGETL